MTYPQFPSSGEIPGFLNPFDPGFMTSEVIGSIYGTVTTPVAAVGGGAVVVASPWNNPPTFFPTDPRMALFGWTYINVRPPGFTGTSPAQYWPQIVGPRFAYWGFGSGGVPFIT